MAINSLGVSSGSGFATQADLLTAGGLVKITDQSFSAVTSVNVNNCFSSTYVNYRIILSQASTDSATTVTLRMRASGTDATTAYYAGCAAITLAAVGFYGVNNGSSIEFLSSNGADTYQSCVWDVTNPNLARSTSFAINSIGGSSSTARNLTGAGLHITASAYDGFSLTSSSGNISGTLRIYGYRN